MTENQGEKKRKRFKGDPGFLHKDVKVTVIDKFLKDEE